MSDERELPAAAPEGEADGAEGTAERAPWWKRYWLLIAIGALVFLTVGVVAAVAYKSAAAKKRHVEVQEEQRVISGAVRDAEAIVERKEIQKAHRAIMSGSPSEAPVAEAPGERKMEAEAPAAAEVPAKAESVAKSETAAKAPVAKAAEADQQAVAEKPAEAAPPARVARNAQRKVNPPAVGAAGNCNLSGATAEDYGKALGRCLEEFNRLDGRNR